MVTGCAPKGCGDHCVGKLDQEATDFAQVETRFHVSGIVCQKLKRGALVEQWGLQDMEWVQLVLLRKVQH